MDESLWHKPVVCSPSSRWFITFNFSSVLTVFHKFFTWIAPDDVALHFSVISVTKANAVEGCTKSAA
jgi:hypothetical protein